VAEAGEITRLLEELADETRSGSDTVLERLMPLVYEELRALALSCGSRFAVLRCQARRCGDLLRPDPEATRPG